MHLRDRDTPLLMLRLFYYLSFTDEETKPVGWGIGEDFLPRGKGWGD